MPDVEFINDWSSLEEAAARLGELAGKDYVDLAHGYSQEEDDDFAAMAHVAKYVPLLISQWCQLFELSENLVKLVEAQKRNETPAGLVLPTYTGN